MGINYLIHRKPTQIYGLKYEPSFMIEEWNSYDSFIEYNTYVQNFEFRGQQLYHGPIDWTNHNSFILESLISQYAVQKTSLNFMEIGVCRQNPSSTSIFLSKLRPDDRYFGIDIRDVSQLLHSPHNNTFFKQSDSRNRTDVIQFIKQYVNNIDILFIDGDHSINLVLNDWCYVELLAPNGCVVLHDTNHHPGPREVFEAIREDMFMKLRFCLEDYGIGFAQKIKD